MGEQRAYNPSGPHLGPDVAIVYANLARLHFFQQRHAEQICQLIWIKVYGRLWCEAMDVFRGSHGLGEHCFPKTASYRLERI